MRLSVPWLTNGLDKSILRRQQPMIEDIGEASQTDGPAKHEEA
jgi:hypothetical protein